MLFLTLTAVLPAKINLVPSIPGKTGSYWCTWSAQNDVDEKSRAEATIMGGHSLAADNLRASLLFNKNGWARQFATAREDLVLLLEVGWDVPGNTRFDEERWQLGSFLLPTDKFPSLSGGPVERLQALVRRVRAAGWRGLGLWFPAHAYGDYREGRAMSDSEVESFWRERLGWCREAGVLYLKVDYGYRPGTWDSESV